MNKAQLILHQVEPVYGFMSSGELTWLINEAGKLKPGDTWVELGCLCGRSLLAVGLALPDDCVLISVDCNWGQERNAGHSAHDIFQQIANRRGHKLELHAVKGFTQNVVNRYLDRTVAGIFIDADHSLEGTRDTIKKWLPKVKYGGLMCGHDYNPTGWPGVVAAVKECFPNKFDVFQSIWSTTVNPTAPGEEVGEQAIKATEA